MNKGAGCLALWEVMDHYNHGDGMHDPYLDEVFSFDICLSRLHCLRLPVLRQCTPFSKTTARRFFVAAEAIHFQLLAGFLDSLEFFQIFFSRLA